MKKIKSRTLFLVSFVVALIAGLSLWSFGVFDKEKEGEKPKTETSTTYTDSGETDQPESSQPEDTPKEVKADQGESETVWHILTIVALVVGGVNFFVFNLLSKQIQDKEQVEKLIGKALKKPNQDIENLILGINALKARSASSGNNNTSNNDLYMLSRRVQDLEKALKTFQTPTPHPTPTPTPTPSPATSKLYAQLNSDEYFTSVQDYQTESSIFVLNMTGHDKAQLSLIAIDKLKSYDGWEKAVDVSYQGCSLKEATQFRVIQPGLCTKMSDGTTWKIAQRLKIEIHK